MAVMIIHANKRAFPRPLRALTTRSSIRLHRYRLDNHAPVPWWRLVEQQSNHAFDVDD